MDAGLIAQFLIHPSKWREVADCDGKIADMAEKHGKWRGNAKFGSMFLTPLCRGGWMLGWADVLFDPTAADDEAEITMTDCLWPNFN